MLVHFFVNFVKFQKKFDLGQSYDFLHLRTERVLITRDIVTIKMLGDEHLRKNLDSCSGSLGLAYILLIVF